ncbi:MAG: VOC family protein [Candidatus Paceibacterota bacterium]|jgi:catechol 2,3-dioxygenase-like lactoylglutathione lyase family enzyme
MPIGIKHIEIWVSDLNKSLSFYESLFSMIGWNKVSENGFKSGDTKIYFKQSDKVKTDTLGPRHICFWADSREMVDKVGDFLKTQNAKVVRGPIEMVGEKYSEDYYTIDFYDPDDFIIEVTNISK